MAPRWIASTTVAIFSSTVMSITGICGQRSLMRTRSSSPSMSGICRSVTTKAGGARSMVTRASMADDAVCTRWPACSSASDMYAEELGSSSTTSRFCPGIRCSDLRLEHRQSNRDEGAAVLALAHGELPTSRFDQAACEKETEAAARRLGGHPRLEQHFAQPGIETRAVVLHHQAKDAGVDIGAQDDLSRRSRCFRRVFRQDEE